MVRSLILYRATTTDANYNLLKTMKEKKDIPKYIHSILEKEEENKILEKEEMEDLSLGVVV